MIYQLTKFLRIVHWKHRTIETQLFSINLLICFYIICENNFILWIGKTKYKYIHEFSRYFIYEYNSPKKFIIQYLHVVQKSKWNFQLEYLNGIVPHFVTNLRQQFFCMCCWLRHIISNWEIIFSMNPSKFPPEKLRWVFWIRNLSKSILKKAIKN